MGKVTKYLRRRILLLNHNCCNSFEKDNDSFITNLPCVQDFFSKKKKENGFDIEFPVLESQ